ETDRILVEFMSTNRKGRETMLATRSDELFRAIKNVQKHYKKTYKDRFRDTLPDEIGQLRTRTIDREKPTGHDRAARLMALITLADEAEWLINNLSSTRRFEEQNLAEELENTQADKTTIALALKFKDTRKQHTYSYKSALYRGGFNTGDLAIKGLKVLGAMTVISNVANSIKDASGDDIFEKITDAVGKTVTNPAVLAGAAVTAGAHAIEQYPELKNYPFASEYGRHGITTYIKLDRLSKKVGSENLAGFTGSFAEWEVMEQLQPRQIKQLLEKAKERDPSYPMIRTADLEGLITERRIMSALPGEPVDSRVRYLFYQRFISGSEKPNIGQLREMCTRT
ncbi:hypothetical protein KKF04_04675, partial [Patescibacteria group bacterium]|nr:hypothetical protein [Patescibacteria group bacterium]